MAAAKEASLSLWSVALLFSVFAWVFGTFFVRVFVCLFICWLVGLSVCWFVLVTGLFFHSIVKSVFERVRDSFLAIHVLAPY